MGTVDADVGLITDAQETLLVPLSDEAKRIFALLGMEPDCVGIVANFDPWELATFLPEEFVIMILDSNEYIGKNFQEITLPDELPVVH